MMLAQVESRVFVHIAIGPTESELVSCRAFEVRIRPVTFQGRQQHLREVETALPMRCNSRPTTPLVES